MRLEEACNRFNELAGIRFGDLFSPADMDMIIINKGKTGQLLELSLGMHLSSTNLDFEDGELKTNKCDAAGNPRFLLGISMKPKHIQNSRRRTFFGSAPAVIVSSFSE